MTRLLLAALGLALASSSALAAPSPAARGLIAGGLSLGGEVVGGVGLGLVGFGLGGLSCRSGNFECWGPLIGGTLGLTGGAVVGAPLGGALGAQLSQARPGRAALYSLAGLGTGIGVMIVGGLAHSEDVVSVGLFTAAVGMPVMAGVGAATDRNLRDEPGVSLIVAPRISREQAGITVTLAGF